MRWLDERESDSLFIRHRVVQSVHKERSKYQEIEVVDTVDFGRMLLLDGVIQTSIRDEFIYHEMLAHVPLFSHPKPERVLVIGGGDGGTVREVLRHPGVRQVHLVEIDERVIEVSKEYLPQISCGLSDRRVKVTVGDGIEYVSQIKGLYDVILVDAPDPEGPAEGLFTADFYANARRALRKDGLLAAQTESPFTQPQLVMDIYDCISGAFPACKLYTAQIPTYSVGLWSFALALTRPEMLGKHRRPAKGFGTRYYNAQIHDAAFALPQFVVDQLQPPGGEQSKSIS